MFLIKLPEWPNSVQMSSFFKLTWTVIYYCKRQPYFSIEPISKTGYWLGVFHGWFHLQGLPRTERNTVRARIMKWNILANWRIRTRDLLLTTRTCYHWATGTDVHGVDKNSPGSTCAIFFLINLHAAFLSYYIICIVLLFGELRRLLTLKSLQYVINNKLVCSICQALQINF